MDKTLKTKQEAAPMLVHNVGAPTDATYPMGEPELPTHFSFLSAQHGPEHNEEAHRNLFSKLKENGYHPIEINGHFGYPEKSFMVPHNGSEQAKKTIEDLAFKNNMQESVLHSSLGDNELRMRDASPSWRGAGYSHGENFDDFYSVLPTGHKIRLNVSPKQEMIQKSDDDMELKKPHCYGKHDGVWVFHATHPSHNDSLVGDKYDNLDDNGFKDAISHAKKRGIASIVLSGTPPSKLLTRIHPDLGPIEPGHITKSLLAKAFLQPDGGTVTNIQDMSQAWNALPHSLKAWGEQVFPSLPLDAIEVLPLDGKTIKIRKHGPDQYSGWIEHNGNKIHGFERLTLPELLTQIRSKLDLYGKEESAVADEPKKDKDTARLVSTADLGSRLKELKAKVQSDLQSGKLKGKKVSMPVDEFVNEHTNLVDVLESPGHDDDKAEADKQAKELEQKLKEMEAKKDQPEIIQGKDLMAGLSNPEKECEACEQPVDQCICYTGLPKPRLEFDGKKVSIFFKSEWSLEDRENFVEDLKRRAGRILKKRYNK